MISNDASRYACFHQKHFLFGHDLVVFDELHKIKNWKKYLKELYDTKPDTLKILLQEAHALTHIVELEILLRGGTYFTVYFHSHFLNLKKHRLLEI